MKSEGKSQSSGYIPSFKFDVASIRVSEPAASYSQYLSNPPYNSKFDAENLWINQIIATAYDVSYRYQVVGGPDWVQLQRFTIHAKSEKIIDDQLAKLGDDQA